MAELTQGLAGRGSRSLAACMSVTVGEALESAPGAGAGHATHRAEEDDGEQVGVGAEHAVSKLSSGALGGGAERRALCLSVGDAASASGSAHRRRSVNEEYHSLPLRWFPVTLVLLRLLLLDVVPSHGAQVGGGAPS